ncbi:hypothetical protein D9615_006555 [Tricholomella constricta]|uniref:C2H2-type domain-containing protein n=1 Tax=Tricholomella constricta TaxID=117010 RepID=A0A8H5HAI2_9AGAR|nr:hypothetical protein D9615_006555 [Tricholomella constricta]
MSTSRARLRFEIQTRLLSLQLQNELGNDSPPATPTRTHGTNHVHDLTSGGTDSAPNTITTAVVVTPHDPHQISIDDLNNITPRQVLEARFTCVVQATGEIMQIVQVFVRKDIGIPFNFLHSPQFIRRIHKCARDEPTPSWTEDDTIRCRTTCFDGLLHFLSIPLLSSIPQAHLPQFGLQPHLLDTLGLLLQRDAVLNALTAIFWVPALTRHRLIESHTSSFPPIPSLNMAYKCESCDSSFGTERGLERHQQGCEEFLAADEQENTVPNALEIIAQKRAAKKRKREEDLQALAEPSNSTTNMSDEPQMSIPSAADIEMGSPSPPSPHLSAAGRGVRRRRPTWKILEQLPAPPTPLPPQQPVSDVDAGANDTTPPPMSHFIWEAVVRTARNVFGLYREYSTRPTHDPDDTISLQDLNNAQTVSTAMQMQHSVRTRSENPDAADTPNRYHPFRNSTIFGIMNWMWTGTPIKSLLEMIKLVDFLKSDEFVKDDLADFDIRKETADFDKQMQFQSAEVDEVSSAAIPNDGWFESDVIIEVPDGKKHTPDTIPTFTIPGLQRRSLVEVIKRAFSDSQPLHYTPFKTFWQKDESVEAERVHDELFSSDAMIEAHADLHRQPPEPGCDLERVVAALMFWSDSTHLANFGNASLWPLYLWFGNHSKWLRGKPTMGLCQHLAYIPKCAIPVFDGLLEGVHDDTIITLLFILAEWHTLGKLRLHTDTTLQWLEQCTTDLGRQLRKFESNTCSQFDTRELPKEAQARVRRQTRKPAAPQDTSSAPLTDTPAPSTSGRGRGRGRGRGVRGQRRDNTASTSADVAQAGADDFLPPVTDIQTASAPQRRTSKKFNLELIKLHALGDYASFIRRFGTTDSYSTQPGELEHRMVKRFYARTNKNQATMQMTRLERRNQALVRQARIIAKHKKAEALSPRRRQPSHEDTTTTSSDRSMAIEQLRQHAEAAGAATVDDEQDQDADEQHCEELTLDLEEEDEEDVGVGVEADYEHDIGAEDGEDGAGDFEDEEGYADL